MTFVGIGLAVAKYLLKNGHNTVVVSRTGSALEDLRSQYPKQVAVLAGDVCDPSVAQRATDLAISNFGGLDSLVKAAIPALRKSHGRVVFVSSGSAVRGSGLRAAYGTTKAAMNRLALAMQIEEPDITTVAVRPGVVDTEMQRELREDYHGKIPKEDIDFAVNLHKKGELLRPEQPGHVIARLALGARKEYSGKFISWNDESLKDFQD
ncbi:MAG: hypothetical protein Q9227_007050 [Pyrenula ochraceoflavens]